MKYQAVLIIGPGIVKPRDTLSLDKLKKLYSKEGFLTLGDGKRPITNEDFTKIVGKIDSNTRIDIFAHGTSNNNSHYMQLSSVFQTKELFKHLAKIAKNEPLHMHLWSCHGGAAKNDVSALPEGSVLVSHASSEAILSPLVFYSLENAIQNLQAQTGILSPYQAFLSNIATDSMQPESFSLVIDGKAKHFMLKPDLIELLENTEQTLAEISQDFIKFYEEIRLAQQEKGGLIPQYLLAEKLTISEVTSEQCTNLHLGNFMYHSDDAGFNFTKIEESSKAMEIIKPIINEKINFVPLLTPVCMNGHTNAVKFYLDNGADPDITNNVDRSTPLHNAAFAGYIEIVNLLLAKGANTNLANLLDGTTPLMVTSQGNHTEIAVALLANGANPNLTSNNGDTALIVASQTGNNFIVSTLLASGANPNMVNTNGYSPLLMAANGCHDKTVELLLSKDANPNFASSDGATPILIASQEGCKKVVTSLLRKEVNPNAANQDGYTPLHAAVRNGHLDTSELLLKCGAKTSAKFQGLTAIKWAKKLNKDSIVKLLEDFITQEVEYAPKDCPSHPDYIEHDLIVGATGDFE